MINFGITERKTQELQRRMQKCNLLENDIEEPTETCYKDRIIIVITQSEKGETDMGDGGKKNKGKKEQQKKAQLNPKEKRKLKKEKKAK